MFHVIGLREHICVTVAAREGKALVHNELPSMTATPAYLGIDEKKAGSLESGKFANRSCDIVWEIGYPGRRGFPASQSEHGRRP